jgi:hypothetical protein
MPATTTAVSPATVSPAAVKATGVGDVDAAFVSTVEATMETVMKTAVEVSEIVGSSGVETAIVAAAIVATVIVATVQRFDRTAACQCQARNDQASNDHLAAVRPCPPREAARAHGYENRVKKRVFHH